MTVAPVPSLPPITQAIAGVALRDPARVAVIDRGRRVSYAMLDGLARRAAAWALRGGIAPGDRVGIAIRDEFPHLLACLALLRLGCTQVTLAGHDTPEMQAALAARLGVTAVLADEGAAPPPPLPVLRFDAARIAGDAALAAAVLPDLPPGAGAFVFPSSGTTGRPKLCLMTEGVMAAQAAITGGIARVRHRLATNEYSNGKRLQLQTLSVGGTEVLANNGVGRSLAETCRVFGIERLNLAPNRAARLAEEAARPGAEPFPGFTTIMIGGGAVPGPVRDALQRHVTRDLIVSYGCTEAGGIAMAGPHDHAAHPDSVGRPFPGVDVAIVDEGARPLPAGVSGLVRVRSAGVVQGYLDDPALTARAFRDGWFLPGDVGRFSTDGVLTLEGRVDEMMNLGTIKIFPAEIEATAEGFPGVAECAAVALRAEAHGDIPVLAVVPGPGFDAASLLAHCRARLGLRAPRKIVTVPALPRNHQGKVQRVALAGAVRAAR